MANVELNFDTDLSSTFSQLTEAKKQLAQVGQSVESVDKELTDLSNNPGMAKMQKQISNQNSELAKLNQTYAQLKAKSSDAANAANENYQEYLRVLETVGQAEANRILKFVEDAKQTELAINKEIENTLELIQIKEQEISVNQAMLEQQAQIIAEEQSEAGIIEQLKAELKQLTDERAKANSVEDIQAINAEIDKEKQKLKELEGSYQKEGNTARNVLRDLKKEYNELVTQSQEALKAGNKALSEDLLNQAAQVEDTILDIRAQTKTLSSDTLKTDAIVQGVATVTAGFQVAQGAIALFGIESEDTQKALVKLNAAMAITSGLQQIQNALLKESPLRQGYAKLVEYFNNVMNTSTVAQEANTVATVEQTVAVEAEAVATTQATVAQTGLNRAIFTSPLFIIGAVVAAIAAAYLLWSESISDTTEKERELTEVEKELQEIQVNSIANSIKEQAQAKLLFEQLKQTNSGSKERSKLITEINNKYGTTLKNLKDETAFLQQLSASYELVAKSIQLKAKAGAAEESLIKLYTRQIELQGIIGESINNTTGEIRQQNEIITETGTAFDVAKASINSAAVDGLKNSFKTELESVNAEIERFTGIAIDASDEINKLGLNAKSSGSNMKDLVAQYRAAIAAIQALEKQAGDAAIQLLNPQARIDALEARARNEIDTVKNQLLEQNKIIATISGDAALKRLTDEGKLTESQYELLRILTVAKFTEIEEEKFNIQQQSQQARIDLLDEGLSREIEEINIQFEQRKREYIKLFGEESQELVRLEEQRATDISNATSQANMQFLETQKQIALAQAEQIQIQGANEEELTRAKEEEKLRITIEYAKKQLQVLNELARASGGASPEQQLVILNLENTLKEAEDALLEFERNIPKIDIFKAVFGGIEGISQSDIDAIANSFQQLYSQITSIISQEVDNQIAQNQRFIDSLNQRIDETESAIDREFEKQKAGFANNLQAEENNLKELQAQREQALQEQEKLQKKKNAIETVNQTVNLISAAAQIFNSLAGIPFVGIPLAIALIATMFGAFVATKAQAASVVGNFKDGVIGLEGPGTETSDSIPANLSKGESVMTAKETRENWDLLWAIRKNDKTAMTEALFDLLSGTGVSTVNSKEYRRVANEKSEYDKIILLGDSKETRRELREIKEMLSAKWSDNKTKVTRSKPEIRK